MAIFVLIALFLVSSGIIGIGLLDEERATGGMGIKWKIDMETNQGQVVSHTNDSIIMNDVDDLKIRSIDSNNRVVWEHPYTSLVSYNQYYMDDLLLIDKHNGTTTLECLKKNGGLKWSFTEAGMDRCDTGYDRNLYLHIANGSMTGTVLCLNSNGWVNWRYTDNGSVNLWGSCTDGTVLIDHGVGSKNAISLYDDLAFDELISISSDGSILGKRNAFSYSSIISGSVNFINFINLEKNGTITIPFINDNSLSGPFYVEMGLTKDLQKNWTMEPTEPIQPQEQLNDWMITIQTVNYSFSRSIDDHGNISNTTLSARRTSDSAFRFRTEFQGAVGNVFVNGDTAYLEDEARMIWAVGPDGRAYRSNETGVVWIMGIYGDGLLVQKNDSIVLIGSHGSTEWRYGLDLDTNFNTSFLLANDTIIEVTGNSITAIYKPGMSTTMAYVFILVGVDLLVGLLGSMWLVDHWLHRKVGP